MKKALVIALLSVCSLAFAKSYKIILTSPTKAGTVQLKAGEYKVKVEGTNAVFTLTDSSTSVTAPVKIENSNKKYDSTQLQTTKDGDGERLTEIDLGGSSTKLVF